MLRILFKPYRIKRIRRKKRKALSPENYLKNKEEARKIILSRLKYFTDIYNVSHGRVSIRNQRTRWGSCSRQGNLNFNYRLLTLEPRQRDYVVVHEICHLKEFNHGRNFWQEVSKAVPDYKEIRRELKKIRIT